MKVHIQAAVILSEGLILRALCDNASVNPTWTTDTAHPDLCGACRNRLPLLWMKTRKDEDAKARTALSHAGA